ncbi:hypothetical protein [Herbaspirillum sp. NPDC101397]|uniref:hypothetical protein n=1 Tax=Herbaspirillum sp. NPDC101397 TaxID=3364006 RepID=UPI00383A792D
MEFNIWHFVLVVIGVVYFFAVFHFAVTEAIQEWWEPILMPLILPIIWIRDAHLMELIGTCIFLAIPLLLFAAFVGFIKFVIFIAA